VVAVLDDVAHTSTVCLHKSLFGVTPPPPPPPAVRVVSMCADPLLCPHVLRLANALAAMTNRAELAEADLAEARAATPSTEPTNPEGA
jgi:hypothetical protein